MSANSLSHLLHTAEVNPPPTRPEANYMTGTSASRRQQQQQQQLNHHHSVQLQLQLQQQPPLAIGLTANAFAPAAAPAVPPPPPLPPAPSTSQRYASSSLPAINTGAAQPANSHDAARMGPVTPAARSHTLTQSLYQCADCQKRYSRPEHLARHIQTHTLGKRFFCQVCGKGFARADLLKRHAANHDTANDPAKKRRRTDSSPAAGRVSHACRACAAARVKCEEAKPCTRCRNRNLNCEYSSSEAGSAAAMHLLHLSAHARSSVPEPGQAASSSTGGSPSSAPAASVTQEVGEMPTPTPLLEQGAQVESFTNPYANNGIMDMTKAPFSEFLRDVLYDQPLNPSRPEEAQGLAVLNFCDDANYDLTEIDFGLLGHWNLDEMQGAQAPTQAATPQTDDSTIDMAQMRQKLVKIWTNSPWRWIPGDQDSAYTEHSNLPIPYRDAASQQFQDSQRQVDRVIKDKLDQSCRDQIFSIALQTMKTENMRLRVSSSFPSTDVMDTLIHIFLAAHSCSVSGWIHWGTFVLNTQWPEWLATVAAGGAVMTPVPTLRKFGFAVQEAIRIAVPSRFEENNTGIQNLGLVQALVLVQDIGLWSGNRRKMEIAECHLQIPTCMMRYRGAFQHSYYPLITVDASDEGEVLENKWQMWSEKESWKRLLFHCYLRDAQNSCTSLAPPTMSYAELTLPLPEAKELWFARSAVEWKRQVLARSTAHGQRPPSLPDLIRDINLLTANYQRLDAQFAISIYLHCFWNLIYEWRQLSTVHRSNSFANSYQGGTNLILNSRHQELCSTLHNFQLVTSDWHASLSAQENLLLNLLFINLYVSLDDLQLFAGKEGEEQARRVYPILQQWSESTEARRAVWHAGQILRQAKLFPQGHLKDFYAIGVHHAALALWTFGVVVKATRHLSATDHQDVVLIDGLETNQVQRFITYGQGRPGICSREGQHRIEALDDPKACMDVVQEIFRTNFARGQHNLSPIVENLCQLINQLGSAAWAVGLG